MLECDEIERTNEPRRCQRVSALLVSFEAAPDIPSLRAEVLVMSQTVAVSTTDGHVQQAKKMISPSKGKDGPKNGTKDDLTAEGLSDDLPPPSFQVPVQPQDESEATDEAKSTQLLISIHKAIMNQEPTHSISNPSWKEQIAMYDPIILEDLTAWLNTGGLDSVGVDGEVEPALVRDWCESKSVCFIWASEGWRKKRQRNE